MAFRRVMGNIVIFAAALAMAGNAGAAGFRLAEQDAKANGMGNAFTAVADNAAAVWYNPAAMTRMDGMNVELGSVLVIPSMDHQNEVGSTSIDRIENKTHLPPHFYATRKINQKFAIGLGVNAPFGLSTKWDSVTANTRYTATESEVQSINYNLSGAYNATEKLSVAAGVNYAMVDATLNKRHPALAQDITLEGDGTGTGYNVAVMYKHSDKWNFGANYHSAVKVELEGDMAATGVYTGPVKTELTLPDTLQIGAAYQYDADWLLTAEADYTNWTTYRNVIIQKQADSTVVSTDIKNWKSVWAFRLGTEYKVSDAWKARAGVFYDINPVTEKRFETRMPDSDRMAWSIGAGYTRGDITVDASYTYLKFLEREVNDSLQDSANQLNGKYNASAMLPAVTVSYKF